MSPDPDADPVARERYCELIARADADIPLAEIALWIAAEAHPGLDVARQLARLDALAEGAASAIDGAESFAARVAGLNRFLFVDEGFTGNHDAYQDPENSFLDSVLERRRGIPITLSVVYVEVAGRIGLHASGIGFPGHFLAKVESDGAEAIVDSFHGCVLSRKDCEARLLQLTGQPTPLDEAMFEAAHNREIVCRILRNLKQIYLATRDYEAALGCCERLLLADPDDLVELRDRGLVYQQLQCHGAALQDLERFVEGSPEDPSARLIRKALDTLRQRARQVH
jgi:regulator of sirC expression with transglutaminase-like and TPR domain